MKICLRFAELIAIANAYTGCKSISKIVVEKITMKKWDQKRKQSLAAMATVAFILLASFAMGRGAAAYVAGKSVQTGSDKICVVIDAGHGGDKLRQHKLFNALLTEITI